MKTNYFCPMPWISYAMRSNGYIRVCCYSNQGITSGILRRDDGTPYTYKDNINSMRNCNLLKEIRKCILNGVWHPDCIRCQREYNSKEHNCESRYLVINNYTDFTLEDAIETTNSDGSIDVDKVDLFYYDLRFGTKCNLRCRTCYATDSDGWYPEHQKIYRRHTFVDLDNTIEILKRGGKYIAKGDPYSWFKDEIFWKNIGEHLYTIRSMYIVGGEPLLIDRHFDFLEECIKTENAERICLDYNTNLTVIPKRGMDVWEKFKRVHFGVSVDAIGKVNDYMRYPSKWEIIEKNFKEIVSKPNFSYDFSTTVSVFNIFRIVDTIKWGLDNIRNDRVITKAHPLHGPPFYNVKMFPLKSKKIIEDHLRKQIEGLSGYTDKVLKEIENCVNFYINFMNQDNFENEIGLFWSITDRMDECRNQKIEDYIPELIQLIPRRKLNEFIQL